MADRNIDTVKEALHNTAGVTFLAAEGGEEDIRLRASRRLRPATSSSTACVTQPLS
ncbi:MAG: hypothetical protein U1F05_06905 [Burkholderiales bacterium]